MYVCRVQYAQRVQVTKDKSVGYCLQSLYFHFFCSIFDLNSLWLASINIVANVGRQTLEVIENKVFSILRITEDIQSAGPNSPSIVKNDPTFKTAQAYSKEKPITSANSKSVHEDTPLLRFSFCTLRGTHFGLNHNHHQFRLRNEMSTMGEI